MSPQRGSQAQGLLFALAILGFSFWFFMAVPMASHKEAYNWLWRMREGDTLQEFMQQSVATYRPIGQALMWLAYKYLGFEAMPSNATRQTLLQTGVWLSFLPAWWLMLRAARAPHVFALLAMVVGGVFFTPYLLLFHPWGVFYTPVVITTGALIWLAHRPSDTLQAAHVAGLLVLGAVLALWHPFATALIVAYILGHLIEQFTRSRRLPPMVLIAVLGMVVAMGFLGRGWLGGAEHGLAAKLNGLLMSYKTVEVNKAVSLVATLLVVLAAATMPLAAALRWALAAALVLVCAWLVKAEIPVLMLWLVVAGLLALARGEWRLAAMLGAAFLLPLGSGVGAPAYALFGIMLALSITATGHDKLENLARRVPAAMLVLIIVGAMALGLTQRHRDMPGLARLAQPLLAEKVRTEQLEHGLHWLMQSPWCHAQVGFLEDSLPPAQSTGNLIKRDHRPPTSEEDLQLYWGTARCPAQGPSTESAHALILFTFGGQAAPQGQLLWRLDTAPAGLMQVWLLPTGIKPKGN